MNPRFPCLAAALLSVLCLPASALSAPEASRPPNLVFILVDDLGARDVGCFGSESYRTPHIDALARQSIAFTQAYAACAVCSPSRAAILTGQAPARLHITDWIPGEPAPRSSRLLVPRWRMQLPNDVPTLPELLKRRGYVTACIGKWHLSADDSSPSRRGFDAAIGAGETGHPASYFWPYGKPADSHRVPELAEQGGKPGEYLTDRLTDEALKFISANQGRPFFLYLSHYAVHSPLMGKPDVVARYRAGRLEGGQRNPEYAAMIESVDDSVGRITARLRELGLDRNTVVIFTSDNGGAVHLGHPPATSNLPFRLGKGFPYEGGLRVPLLIRLPDGAGADRRCEVPVISHDLFPTLLEFASVAARPATDGMSLVPLLRGSDSLHRTALFWHYPHYWLNGQVSPYSVVRAGDWKLIRFHEDGHEELYNVRSDPGERVDGAAQQPELRRELGARLDAWLKEVGAQMNPAR